MLSDEEKKAIEDFKECYEKDISRYEDFNTYTQYIVKRNELILNLIEKQSKEIEELKEENKEIREWKFVIDNPIDLEKLKELDLIKIKGKEYISKDKIKAKIDEVDKDENASIPDFIEYAKEYATQKLQSLLEKE